MTTTGFPAPDDPHRGRARCPTGVTFVDNADGTATLVGHPGSGHRGHLQLTITAANGVSPDATQSFTLTVDEAPAITSADATTFTVGSAGLVHGDHHRVPEPPDLTETGCAPDRGHLPRQR